LNFRLCGLCHFKLSSLELYEIWHQGKEEFLSIKRNFKELSGINGNNLDLPTHSLVKPGLPLPGGDLL
jgi:hypothetical protein